MPAFIRRLYWAGGILLLSAMVCIPLTWLFATHERYQHTVPGGSMAKTCWQVGLLSLVGAALCLLIGFAEWERHQSRLKRKRLKQHCTGCGYDLRGSSTSTSCPECGEPLDESPHTQATHLQSGLRFLLIIAGLFLARRAIILIIAGDPVGIC